MSLLTIVQAACAELSLVQPSAVVGSTDRQIQLMFGLANRAGRELARASNWQGLRTEKTFPTVNAVSQPAVIPTDFRSFVPGTFWNRSTRRPLIGPISASQWQEILAQPVFSSVYIAFVERQGVFMMTPAPAAGQTIAFEYISTNWAKSAGLVGQATFQADTDMSYLDEDLITLGLIWRFRMRRGLSYEEERADYDAAVERAIARDGGAPVLTLVPRPVDPNRANLPDGNFGL